MTLDEAMADYREVFEDNYPLMCRMGVDEADMVAEIYECIERGEEASVVEGVEY